MSGICQRAAHRLAGYNGIGIRRFVADYAVACKNRARRTRVGLTATKKVGNAVTRNRARRVMRAALCAVLPADAGGVDLVLVARAATPRLKSTQLEETLRRLCRKAGLLPAADGPGV